MSKKYNWVVMTAGGVYYVKDKPKKVRGGYIDKFGHRFVGTNVTLKSMSDYRN